MRKDSGGSSGKAEIVLSDGSVWTSTPMPNGLYEFVSVDERGHKTTARWVRRSTKRGSVDVESNGLTDFKFTFSIIDPNSRRHPILATITQNKLDIPDYYTSVSQSAGKFPPTSPIRGEIYSLEDESIPHRTIHPIEENTKKLIQVTGIWLALREGWSPYFKYNDGMSLNTTPLPRVRSVSMSPDGTRPPLLGHASTPESANSLSTLGILGSKIRRVSTKASPVNSDPVTREPMPKRSISAGTAFMQREKARRVGNPPSIVASDSEGEGVLIHSYVAPDKLLNEDRTSTPVIPLRLPGSEATTPDTPTRPHRRVQSVSLPSSTLQNVVLKDAVQRHSMLEPTGKKAVLKTKTSRWKSFTNLFRRTKSS